MPGRDFACLLDEYLDALRALNYSPFTIRVNTANLRNFLDWLSEHFHVHSVDRLRRTQLHRWQKSLAGRRTGKGRPLKPRSINKKIEGVRAFLTYLHRHRYTPNDLTEELSYVKVPRMLPTSVLTHKQVRKVMNSIDTTTLPGYRDRTMLEVLYSCGLRARELERLDVQHIDVDSRTVRVMGKGSKERVVPIGRTALRFLESYIQGVRPFMLRDRSETALFLNSRGTRAPYALILRIVHRYTDNTDLDVVVTPHTFRRSCTSELVRANANIYHVKELLGHATLKHLAPYIKLNITDLKKTHARFHPREQDEKRDRG